MLIIAKLIQRKTELIEWGNSTIWEKSRVKPIKI